MSCRVALTAATIGAGLTLAVSAQQPAPATVSVDVRLQTAVSSPGSKPGDAVTATVLGLPGDSLAVASGCVVTGTVRPTPKAAGIGDRHTLALTFDAVRDRLGVSHPLTATLVRVDNAREAVADGVVLGLAVVRARPPAIEAFLMLAAHAHPITLAAAEAVRLGVKATERPAIEFHPGVRLSLAVRPDPVLPTLDCDGPRTTRAAPDAATTAWALAQPIRAQAGEPPREADWINLIAVGTRDALERAFLSAGWETADRVSVRVDVRTFFAVMEREQYQTGPVSTLKLAGASPALVFQKQTNTFAKRHHVRWWPAATPTPDGRTAWVGAATHDIGLEFSRITKHYTHRIDGAIDDERRSLLADLGSVNHLETFGFAPRSTVPAASTNATGDKVTTDSAVAVFQVTASAAPAAAAREASAGRRP
ncbi:MAG: LssY C-terminal domain-containing protein [Acidobacteriota bacterium]